MGYTRFSVSGDVTNYYSLKGNIMPANCNSKKKKKRELVVGQKENGTKTFT